MSLESIDLATRPVQRHPAWDAVRRVRRHFWFKCFGSTVYMTLFFVAYIHLLKNPAGPVRIVPLTALDGWIGLVPWVLPVYLSLWVYVCLPAALMTTRREVVHFGLSMGTLCAIGLAVFWVWPNAIPPRNIDWERYPGMAFLKGVDAAGNAFPSLHVATAVFAAYWLHRMAPQLDMGRRVRRWNGAWCAAICYSTVATGQHVVVDVAAGAVLGWAMARLTYPRRRFSGLEPVTRTPASHS